MADRILIESEGVPAEHPALPDATWLHEYDATVGAAVQAVAPLFAVWLIVRRYRRLREAQDAAAAHTRSDPE
jgi:hypothetical protein